MTVAVVFVTHGLVNAVLLSSYSTARCSFWNLPECNSNQDWMLNWLSFSALHLHVLLACLAYSAVGNPVLELRLVVLVGGLIVASLTAAVFMLPTLNQPMALLQVVIYFNLLGALLKDQMVVSSPSRMMPAAAPALSATAWRNSSFDARKKLPMSTIVLGLQFTMQLVRVGMFTFGTAKDSFIHHASTVEDDIFTCISDISMSHMLWVALILGFAILGAVKEQQQMLLKGHVCMLFLSMWMMACEQGAEIVEEQRRAAVVATFSGIVTSVLGSL